MDCSGYSKDSEEYSHSVLEQVNNMNGAINGFFFSPIHKGSTLHCCYILYLLEYFSSLHAHDVQKFWVLNCSGAIINMMEMYFQVSELGYTIHCF